MAHNQTDAKRARKATAEADKTVDSSLPFAAAAAFKTPDGSAAVTAASPGEIAQTQTAIAVSPDGVVSTTVVTTTTVTTTTTTTTTTRTYLTGEMAPVPAQQLELPIIEASTATGAAPETAVQVMEGVSATESSSATQTATATTVLPYEKSLGYRFVKRAFDIVFSAVVLVALSWLYLILAIVVKADSPGPAIFRQTRVGKNGEPFTLFKYRSMVENAEDLRENLQEQNEKSGPVFKMREDPRITRVGRFIRKTSLDELPQFVNVLRGEMSVVGPRPALPKEVVKYTDHQKERLLVKPGITCYWQTTPHRDSIEFEEWVELDRRYIRERSVWIDLKLIVKTIGVVFTAEGS